jgi:hypothetical protein
MDKIVIEHLPVSLQLSEYIKWMAKLQEDLKIYISENIGIREDYN